MIELANELSTTTNFVKANVGIVVKGDVATPSAQCHPELVEGRTIAKCDIAFRAGRSPRCTLSSSKGARHRECGHVINIEHTRKMMSR